MTGYCNNAPYPERFTKNIIRLVTKCATTLESLHIRAREEEVYDLFRKVELPRQLRKLSLHCTKDIILQKYERLPCDSNIETLRGTLRTFKLYQPTPPLSLGYLRAFANLSRLAIQLTQANLESFTSALARLPRLRALELSGNVLTRDNWDTVLEAIAVKGPELEHLTFDPAIEPSLFSIETLLRLERLVSVQIRPHWERGLAWDNGWLKALVEKGQLEHLGANGMHMSVDELIRVVSKCKVRHSCYFLNIAGELMGEFENLRYLWAIWDKLGPRDLQMLADAASGVRDEQGQPRALVLCGVGGFSGG